MTSPSLPEILTSLPRFVFFTGKGGVGKTSLACATAVSLADSGERVLLVGTDPASNLDEVLETKLTSAPTPIEEVPNLDALNIDPEAAAQAYRDRLIEPVRGILPEAALRSMEEQLSGACTLEIASFDEFSLLLGHPSRTKGYDHVVFDTAPTGHTLRLLRLPAAWTGFLDENKSGNSCLGPVAGLEKQRSIYETALFTLSDPDLTKLILVARPDLSSLREAKRSSRELLDIGVANQSLILNGVFPDNANHDPVADSIRTRQARAIRTEHEFLGHLNVSKFPLRGQSPIGVESLRHFFRTSNARRADDLGDSHCDLESLMPTDEFLDNLLKKENGVIMTMGKGGVGKTTLACALAQEAARRGMKVCLTTTDPAAHVEDTVDTTYENLRIERIDPQAETATYIQETLEQQGTDLDDDGKALLEEDLRSPCTEEIAVFRAFARTIDRAEEELVVIDTAPTGHTLLLLDATESYHRELSRQSHEQGKSAIAKLLPRLRDPEFTRILLVTLPESTPVHEARALQKDLERASIHPWGWIVNRSLTASSTKHPLLLQRAAAETPLFHEIVTSQSLPVIAFPWSNPEAEGLGSLFFPFRLLQPQKPTTQKTPKQMSPDNKFNILFLCTGNSARSIMGEYIMRDLAGDRFEVYSAGAAPKGTVNPHTINVLEKHLRIDASDARSKSWDEYNDVPFDFVITVCDHAKESCPVWPGQPVVAHWRSPDPVDATGTDEEIERFFFQVAMQIKRRIELFCSFPLEKLEKLRLQQIANEVGTKEKLEEEAETA